MNTDSDDVFHAPLPNPMEWEIVRIEDIIFDIRGGSPLEPEDFVEKGFPVLHKGAIKSGGQIEIDPKKKAFTHDSFVKKYTRAIVTRDYVVVTLRDLVPSGPSIGMMSYLKNGPCDRYILAQGAYGFKVKKEWVCPEYLVWLSNEWSYRKLIRSLSVGSTQIHVRTPVFTGINIPLPSLSEQRRITAILARADRLRRLRRHALELSENYLQSVFVQMFSEKLESSSAATYLGDLVTITGGGTPSRDIPEFYDGEIPWLTAKDMRGFYISDTEEHITEEAIKRSATKLVPAGSILIVVKSKVLMHRLPLAISKVPLCHGQDIKSIQCSDRVEPEFVVQVLKYYEPEILRQARGANTEGLTLPMLEAVSVPDINRHTQMRFAAIAAHYQRLRVQQREALRQAEHLFETLLHRAFRGELGGVVEIDKEVASIAIPTTPPRAALTDERLMEQAALPLE